MSEIRTRFAPSPTGHLHIGSARTALYNWLVARADGGTFVLRIEDTDLERSSKESVDSILEAMKWMGMDWDEGPGKGGDYGPYFQTERLDIYKKHIDQLFSEGKAYRCYATKEELDELREKARQKKETFHYDGRWRDKTEADWPTDKPYVIRFKAPQSGEVVVNDKIIGQVTFDIEKNIDDFIIARSDGMPTYNFTVVVDDVTMKITEVIRGDDHLNNTPKQILLYEALGYPVPDFAHMPLTLGKDRSRLSKRHGATSVIAYRDMGFLPEALVNYLVRLGWSHGDEEIFSTAELIEKFSIDAVSKSSGIFDQDKLDWISQQYIMNEPKEKVGASLLPFLKDLGVETSVDAHLIELMEQIAPRSKTLFDMAEQMKFFFSADFEYAEKADRKFLKPASLPILDFLAKELVKVDDFKKDNIHAVFESAMSKFELKLGKIAQPVRIAMCGKTVSPGIFEVLELLGKDETISRLERAVSHVAKKEEA